MTSAIGTAARRLADGVLWVAAVLGVVSMAAFGAPRAPPALAFWTDDAQLTTDSFAAHVVQSPTNIDCYNEGGVLGLLGYVRMNWQHVDTRYVYDWRVIHNDTDASIATGTLTPAPSTPQGGALNHEIRIGLLDIGLGTTVYTFEVRARLQGTNWSAATVVTEGLQTQQLLVGLSVRCISPV